MYQRSSIISNLRFFVSRIVQTWLFSSSTHVSNLRRPQKSDDCSLEIVSVWFCKENRCSFHGCAHELKQGKFWFSAKVIYNQCIPTFLRHGLLLHQRKYSRADGSTVITEFFLIVKRLNCPHLQVSVRTLSLNLFPSSSKSGSVVVNAHLMSSSGCS